MERNTFQNYNTTNKKSMEFNIYNWNGSAFQIVMKWRCRNIACKSSLFFLNDADTV